MMQTRFTKPYSAAPPLSMFAPGSSNPNAPRRTSASTSGELEAARLRDSPYFQMLQDATRHFCQYGPPSLTHPNLCLEILIDVTWEHFFSHMGSGNALSQADPVLLFLRGCAASRLGNLHSFETTLSARGSRDWSAPPPYIAPEFEGEFLYHFVKDFLHRMYPVKSVLSRTSRWQDANDAGIDLCSIRIPSEIDFERPSQPDDTPLTQYVYFPDLRWLGGRHDGYPLCLSVSSYMKVRYVSGNSRREDAALWQMAMSFGLLEAIMEIKIPASYLLSPGADASDSEVITSRNVSTLLLDWHRRLDTVCRQDSVAGGEWVKRAEQVMIEVLGALDDEYIGHERYCCGHLSRAGCSDSEVADILCALATICEAARDVLLGVFQGLEGGSWNTLYTYGSHRPNLAAVYREKMRTGGWCPNVFTRLNRASLRVLAYAQMHQPFIRNAPDEHKHCKEDHCVVLSVDTAAYHTRHVSTSCQCAPLRPHLDAVLDLLSHSSIPVIVASDPDVESLPVRSTVDGPYVAISHVWADGLGSTSEDGLPTCQVKRIGEFVRLVLPEGIGSFWMDSLCVPAERTARKRAITLMAQTYQNAEAVLVIDAGIISECSMKAPLEENLLHITISSWMSRVWTLQEGVLARKLHFVFSDGIISLDDLIDHSSFRARRLRNGLDIPLTPVMFSIRYTRSDHGDLLPTVIGELEGRTTTKPEDETVAVAVFMGIDPVHLLAHDSGEERMKTLLLEAPGLPKSLIFSDGPRMTEPGLRWAPRSLTGAGRPWPYGDLDAVCTPEGLVTDFDILFFPPVQLGDREREESATLFHPATQNLYRIVIESPAPNYQLKFNGLLLVHDLPQNTEDRACAAVQIHGIDDDGAWPELDDEGLVTCEYKHSARLSDITKGTTFTTSFGIPIRPPPVIASWATEVHVLVT